MVEPVAKKNPEAITWAEAEIDDLYPSVGAGEALRPEFVDGEPSWISGTAAPDAESTAIGPYELPTAQNIQFGVFANPLQLQSDLSKLHQAYDDLKKYTTIMPWLAPLIDTTQTEITHMQQTSSAEWQRGANRLEMQRYLVKRFPENVYFSDAHMLETFMLAKISLWQRGLQNFENLSSQAQAWQPLHNALKILWNGIYAQQMDRVNDVSQKLPPFEIFIKNTDLFKKAAEQVMGPLNLTNPKYMEVKRIYEAMRMLFGDISATPQNLQGGYEMSAVDIQQLASIFPFDEEVRRDLLQVIQLLAEQQNANAPKQSAFTIRVFSPEGLLHLQAIESALQNDAMDLLSALLQLEQVMNREFAKIFWERDLESMVVLQEDLKNLQNQFVNQEIDEIDARVQLANIIQTLQTVMAVSYGEDLRLILESHQVKHELQLKDETNFSFMQRRLSVASLEGRRRLLFDIAAMLKGEPYGKFPDLEKNAKDPLYYLPAQRIRNIILGEFQDDPRLTSLENKDPQLIDDKVSRVGTVGVEVWARQAYAERFRLASAADGVAQHSSVEKSLAMLQYAADSLQYVDKYHNLLLNYQHMNDIEKQLADIGELGAYYDCEGKPKSERIFKMRQKWAKAYDEVSISNGDFAKSDRTMQGILQHKHSLAKQTEHLTTIHARQEFALDVAIVLMSSYAAPFAAGYLLRGASLAGRGLAWVGSGAMEVAAVDRAVQLARGAGALTMHGLTKVPGLTRVGQGAMDTGRWLLTTQQIRNPAFGFAHALSFQVLDKNFQFVASEIGVGRPFVWDQQLNVGQNAAHFAWDVMFFNPMLRVLGKSEQLAVRLLPNSLKTMTHIPLHEQIAEMEFNFVANPSFKTFFGGWYYLGSDVAKQVAAPLTRFAGEYMGFNVWALGNDVVFKSTLRFADGEFQTTEDLLNYWNRAFSWNYLSTLARENLSFLLGLKAGGAGAKATFNKITGK